MVEDKVVKPMVKQDVRQQTILEEVVEALKLILLQERQVVQG